MKRVGDMQRVAALLAPLVVAASAASCNRAASSEGITQQTSAVVTTLPQFVLYGERSVKLGNNTHVNGGDVGVRTRTATSFGAQLKLAQTVLVDTHRTLFAPSVSLDAHAVVGNVDTDALTNVGATRGALAAFPAADMPPGPFLGGAAPGATNVTVASGANRTLDPGSYGALSDSGTVFLKPGAYSFSSITLADRARLVANGPGTSSVLVAGQLVAGTHVALASLSGGAGALSIFVAGNDATKSAVTIGTYASIVALVAAPHGTLALGDHTDATGAYAGFDVTVGEAVVLTYQKGFPAPPANPPQQLTGYVTPAIASAPLVGPVPQDTSIDLEIGLALPDRPGVIQKFHDVSDPTSPSYRQYLTPATFAATFSPSAASYAQLTSWATAAGLTVTEAAANRLLLGVRGTAGQIEQVLSSGLVYRARPDGTSFYALDREPAVTLAASNPIFRISGLDNRVVATPGAVPSGASPGVGTGPGGLYVSADYRAAYASCTTNTGAGEKVGLFELDGFKSTDITGYGCNSGLLTCDALGNVVTGALPPVSTVLVDGYGGGIRSTVGQGEVTIDIQVAMGLAPGLSGVVVFEAQNDGNTAHHNHILNKMAADTTIRQHSSSWFFNVDGNTQTILYTLALQGQSFMQCAGDEGSSSWSGDPGDIRDLDGVTVVGGTILKMTLGPTTYQSETTWNRAGEGAGGGGIASSTPSPLNQAPFSTAAGAMGKRVFPDLSMVATDELGFFNGVNSGFAGTSLAAPLYAAWVALANQQSASQGIGPAGYVNTFLYDVAGAAAPIYAASFNDIADNSNNAGSCPSGVSSAFCPNSKWALSTTSTSYSAVAGFDLATGLGTPKCYLLGEVATSVIQAPTPDGGAGGAGGADGGVATPSLAVVATEAGRGVEFCMQGGGFDPGHAIQFKFLNLPALKPGQDEIEAPEIVSSDGSFTNFDSTFGGGASSQQGFIQNCTADDLTRSMTIQVTQLDDPSKFATASISNAWVCGGKPLQTPFDETPLPFPPMFGQTTCPLPPQ